MVITITGIIAAVVAVFMRAPITGYFDTARRAALTDTADLAIRRITRDVQLALPNSLRPTSACVAKGSVDCGFEFLLTSTGGRYLQDAADTSACFSGGCASIQSIGSIISESNEFVEKRLVIYNLHNNENENCSDNYPSAWCSNNIANIVASQDGGANDSFSINKTVFRPSTGSPSRTFFIVSGPVAYVCSNVGEIDGNGTGKLFLYTNYVANQKFTLPPAGATPHLLAHKVSACEINYSQAVARNNGLVELHLELLDSSERVGLHHEIHIDNTP